MFIKTTPNGTLYGKTGSGTNKQNVFVLGGFVGYLEKGGNTYAFACILEGENIMMYTGPSSC